MSPWRARMAVLGVFFLGLLSGIFVARLYVLHMENEIFNAPDPMAQVIIRRLDQQLDLTDQQKEQIHEIVLAGRTEVVLMQKDFLPKIVAIVDRGSEKVRQVLTPEQRAKFDKITREKRARILQDIEQRTAPK